MMSTAAVRRPPSEGFFGLDPDLPGLSRAFDLSAVSKLYEERWSGRGHAGLRVRARELHGVRYQPSVRCLVAHELTLERGGDEPRVTIGVVDVRPAGVDLRAFHEDPDLPWLADATDPERACRYLVGPDSRIIRVVPVRYKVASRCLLRFELEAGSVPRTLYGKVLAMDGSGLWRTLVALRDVAHGRCVPRVLQPLDYLPDLHMFVLPAVGSAELHLLAFDTRAAIEARLQWMRKAGAVLAGLHAARVPAGRPRRLSDDAADLARFAAPVARLAPSLARAFDEAVRRLGSVPDEEPSGVISHGAFRTDQLLVEGDEPLMVDLDNLCWANPARDVANFLAYLRWKAVREPHHSSFIETAVASFLEGYGSVRMLPDERWTARYEASSMLKIVGRRFRNLDVNEWTLAPRLLDEARALLGRPSAAAGNGSRVGIPPSAVAALDVETMSPRLRALLRPLGDGTRVPVVTSADLVWHKPDHRWTIRYKLAGDGDEVLGKMYRDPARGRRSHEIMRWLWDHAASGFPEFGVPQPLGWIPELSMLVYLPAPGRALGDAIFDARSAAYMHLAAAWLAALHRCPLPLDRAFDVGSELATLRTWSSIVGERHPDQAGAAHRIRRRLSELSSALGAPPAGPIHKDFHYQHVFVADDRVSVIDFDEVRLGDPNFDLAHFCAYLRLLGYRITAMAQVIDGLRDHFLTAYARRAGWQMDGRFAAFYAYTCLKIAWQLCTGMGVAPRPQAEERRRQAAAMLEEGVAILESHFPG